MINPQDIWSFITTQETSYDKPIQVVDNWDWGMKEHITKAVLYKNSTYLRGKDDNKPYKNITRPILNLQYRAEGFDVKDIELYVEDTKNVYKSFLVRKYHDNWARESHIDTFIDNMVESYVDFGSSLVKKTSETVPEVVPLQSIAFCDQTDILSGPIGIKHFYSPDQLKEKKDVGWGDTKNGATISIDDLIILSLDQKVKDKATGVATATPGKYIEIYEVHGTMPKKFLNEDDDSGDYISQIQIVGYYHNKTKRHGVVLFAKEEKDSPFKLINRDAIFGRAIGLGGVEELEEAQVWTNYAVIREKDMLDSASKTFLQTTDPSFTNRNKVKNAENLEVFTLEEGKQIGQIDTFPRNYTLFERSINDWQASAQQMGSANESIMGEQPKSGTPFALQQLVTAESHSLHEYRKGKLATFLDEIYQDWIIPYISREVTKDQEFLAELDLKEMQEVVDMVVENTANKEINRLVLSGEMIDPTAIEVLKEKTRTEFMKSNKKTLKIIAGEMKDSAVVVKINIAGKQKYSQLVIDKLTNVFRQIMVNPQVLANPAMSELFNKILESSGLSPIDFSSLKNIQQPQQLTAGAPVGVPA